MVERHAVNVLVIGSIPIISLEKQDKIMSNHIKWTNTKNLHNLRRTLKRSVKRPVQQRSLQMQIRRNNRKQLEDKLYFN